MYNITDKFLYEILDDYKDANTDIEKDEIVSEFMKLIWSSNNKRKTHKKYIRFSVPKRLLATDIGKIFNIYSDLSYTAYKSMTKDKDFVSLIRQKINNIYTNLCDGEVCLKKEYMDLIKLPKQMYFRWKSGEVYGTDELTNQIDIILNNAIEVKEKYKKQKMNISWSDYKKIVAPYFKRMFENFIPLDKFEDKTKLTLDIDMWNEDNFAVAYLCKGLDGYMRNYQKKYYGVKRNKKIKRCISCGCIMYDNDKTKPHKYCNKCKKVIKNEQNKSYYKNN